MCTLLWQRARVTNKHGTVYYFRFVFLLRITISYQKLCVCVCVCVQHTYVYYYIIRMHVYIYGSEHFENKKKNIKYSHILIYSADFPSKIPGNFHKNIRIYKPYYFHFICDIILWYYYVPQEQTFLVHCRLYTLVTIFSLTRAKTGGIYTRVCIWRYLIYARQTETHLVWPRDFWPMNALAGIRNDRRQIKKPKNYMHPVNI